MSVEITGIVYLTDEAGMSIGFVRHAGEVVAFPGARVGSHSWGVPDVERVNQFPLYELGKLLRTVASYVGDVNPMTPLWELLSAMGAVADLLEGKPFPITISREAAQGLRESISTIWIEHYFEKKEDGSRGEFRYPQQNDAPIPEWRWYNIRSALTKFETILAAEIAQATTYFVPSRGIYSTSALIDHADQSFPEEIREYVPDKARNDWCSAGRCLAFSLLSATGFHVARAVEATLGHKLIKGIPSGIEM
jgi:hypothetical protein